MKIELDKIKGSLKESIEAGKEAAKNIKIPDIDVNEKMNQAKAKVEQAREVVSRAADGLKKKEEKEPLFITCLSTESALRITYFLMAADGVIKKAEEDKLVLISKELDPDNSTDLSKVMEDCQNQLNKADDPEDYDDVLQDGIENAIISSLRTEDSFITPKILIWDLLTIAFSDDSYDETERKLIKYIARRLNIDKAIFLEMESSIMTLFNLESEIAWIKTTDRPYLVIEAMLNEISDRKRVIFESVKDLITL